MYTPLKNLNMTKKAEFAALVSFNKAMQSDSDFRTLCVAYANLLKICHQNSQNKTALALEVQGLRLCHRKKTNIEALELKSVAKLYAIIFCMRFVRGEIEHAIDMGFVVSRISNTIHAVTLTLNLMPVLIQALLYRRRVMEAVTVLFELEYLLEEDIDNSGRIWYYAICIGIHLETGYTVLPFTECARLYQLEGDAIFTVRDLDAVKRYFTVMWLWCLRVQDWESATFWHAKITKLGKIGHKTDSLANIFTGLYLLEGMLIFMVGKMDARNIDEMTYAYREIGRMLEMLEETARKIKVISPRFYHLKAFHRYINNEESSALSLLRKVADLAAKLENILEESFIEHTEKAWTNKLNTQQQNFWVDHCDIGHIVDYHEIETNNGKLNHYSYPTPLYI